MTTQEIANQLAEFCRRGEFEKAQISFYADDVTSTEPEESPSFKKEEKGLENIIEKGHRFENLIEETHSIQVSEPLVAGNVIAFTLTMDMTMKQRGRYTMSE